MPTLLTRSCTLEIALEKFKFRAASQPAAKVRTEELLGGRKFRVFEKAHTGPHGQAEEQEQWPTVLHFDASLNH
jgi:hypothetical protein